MLLIGTGLATQAGMVSAADARCNPVKPGKAAEQSGNPGKGHTKGHRPCGSDDSAASLFSSRNDLSATSEPDSERLIARLTGGPASAPDQPVPVVGSSAQDRMGLGVGDKSAERPSRPSHGAFAVWTEGQLASFTNSGQGRFDGRFATVYLGAEYIVTSTMLVGVLVQHDDTSQRSATLDIAAKGSGWMAGPYAMIQLSQHLSWQGRVMWGQSSNAVTQSAAEAVHYDGERWLARGALLGRWRFGDIEFRPVASVAYVEESAGGLSDTQPSSVRTALGQAKLGPEFAYQYRLGDGTLIEPRWSVQGIWNFDQPVTGALAGNLAGPEELRGRLDLGLRAVAPQGLDLDLSAGYDGVGSSSYRALIGRIQIKAPLQ